MNFVFKLRKLDCFFFYDFLFLLVIFFFQFWSQHNIILFSSPCLIKFFTYISVNLDPTSTSGVIFGSKICLVGAPQRSMFDLLCSFLSSYKQPYEIFELFLVLRKTNFHGWHPWTVSYHIFFLFAIQKVIMLFMVSFF